MMNYMKQIAYTYLLLFESYCAFNKFCGFDDSIMIYFELEWVKDTIPKNSILRTSFLAPNYKFLILLVYFNLF